MGHHDHRSLPAGRSRVVGEDTWQSLGEVVEAAFIREIGRFAVVEALRAPSPEAFRANLFAQYPDASQAQIDEACDYVLEVMERVENERHVAEVAAATEA